MNLTPGRVRVVHLVSSLNIGGLEMVVLDLARLSDRARFDVRVVCLQEKGALAPRLEGLGVPVDSLDCPDLARGRTTVRLLRRLRQLRPHVIHTHNPNPHVFGSLAAWGARVAVLVHTKHGRNYPDQFRAVLLNRLATCLSNCIVPVSDDAARVARDVERVPRGKVLVIRNGIDLARFPVVARPVAGATARAIHVARLHPVKDQATLLRAARRVVDAEPSFRLDVVGDGPARAELFALRDELGLGDHVRFLGFRDDVAGVLAAADFFVLTSVTEGISLTLLEAMATGLPVVATDVGGNREVVADGRTGLLVPARSHAALAEAILQLVRNPERTRRLGAAARRRVEEEFDLRRVVARYEQLYLSLLRQRGCGELPNTWFAGGRTRRPNPAASGAQAASDSQLGGESRVLGGRWPGDSRPQAGP
jgi:sugar transferase (PEP-CTERM/EpsH1 system associated)